MKIFYTIILLLTLTTACTTKSKPKTIEEIAANLPTANMNAGKLNYTVKIPDGWTTEHVTRHNVDYYYLYAPRTTDDPNTNINIVTEHMQGLELPVYKAKAIDAIKRVIPGTVILEEGDVKAKGLKGIWFTYTMTIQGVDASLVCYIYPKNGIAYIITAGTQTKDAARYRSTFDAVGRSFKFLGQ